ncbi:hypothetical protein [Vreelandella titanicae]|uniref:hypothetical protein n=1 Tax=Vreelandella titanicae TaxID=664683 RepID=UPI003D267838|tara:strand:- start:666 stop:887 length:222 start_codon:yes stop_codon:yes gene_type:complete
MKIEIRFNQDKSVWEVLSPEGVILESLHFKFPVGEIEGPSSTSSYPTGMPVVTAIGSIGGKMFETKYVSINNN